MLSIFHNSFRGNVFIDFVLMYYFTQDVDSSRLKRWQNILDYLFVEIKRVVLGLVQVERRSVGLFVVEIIRLIFCVNNSTPDEKRNSGIPDGRVQKAAPWNSNFLHRWTSHLSSVSVCCQSRRSRSPNSDKCKLYRKVRTKFLISLITVKKKHHPTERNWKLVTYVCTSVNFKYTE